MKKKLTLTILALLALTLAGCKDNRTPEQRQKAFDAVKGRYIKEFNYQGHRYLLYERKYGRDVVVAGITHDPDCPCQEGDSKKCDMLAGCRKINFDNLTDTQLEQILKIVNPNLLNGK